jgi:hypothetical protein
MDGYWWLRSGIIREKSSWTIGGDNHFNNLLLMITFSVGIKFLTFAVDISSAMAASYWWGELLPWTIITDNYDEQLLLISVGVKHWR